MESNDFGKSKNNSLKKGSSKGRKLIIFTVEVVLLVLMICVLWVVTKVTDEEEGVKHVEISTDDIIINDGVKDQGNADSAGDTNQEAEAAKKEKYPAVYAAVPAKTQTVRLAAHAKAQVLLIVMYAAV